jgi:hypothetical protein
MPGSVPVPALLSPPASSDPSWLVRGLGLVFLARALERLTQTAADPDLWGYLAFGRLFWQSGRFPYEDVFAYLPTLDPWVYHEWLTGVLFYPLYMNLGGAGLQVLKYLLGLATLALIYATARRRGATPLAAILALFLVQGFLALGYSPVRAQVFTYLFFPLTLYLLETARLSGRFCRLWLLLPLQALWANLHGGFLAGLGMVALYSLGEALSRRPFLPYLGIFFLSGLATLINPYGLKYWHYLTAAVSLPRSDISEWISLWRAYKMGLFLQECFLYLAVVVLSSLFLAWVRWRELTPLLIFGLTVYLGLGHLRHQVFTYLVLGVYLPTAITSFIEVWRGDPRWTRLWQPYLKGAGVLLGILFFSFYTYKTLAAGPFRLNLPPVPQSGAKSQIYYPLGAVKYLKDNYLKGNLLTEFNWGEYLIWVLFPDCRVSLDGRYETVYPEVVCREYFDFMKGRDNWREFLAKYPPDLILLDSRSRICSLIRQDKSWQQVYADEGAALFVPAKDQAAAPGFKRAASPASGGP